MPDNAPKSNTNESSEDRYRRDLPCVDIDPEGLPWVIIQSYTMCPQFCDPELVALASILVRSLKVLRGYSKCHETRQLWFLTLSGSIGLQLFEHLHIALFRSYAACSRSVLEG